MLRLAYVSDQQMPKNYTRKSEKAKWNPYAMLAAMADVREKKMTLFEASVKHSVPRSTLNYRMRHEGEEFKAAYVRETVIGYKNEKLLIERIIHLQRVGFGLTASDVRRMAYEFAVKNDVPRKPCSTLTRRLLAGIGTLALWSVIQKYACAKARLFLSLEQSV